jgi:hypothetical protein
MADSDAMRAAAIWGVAGVIVGGLITGAASVYTEYIKGVRERVQYRTEKADETLKLASDAISLYIKRQIQARYNPTEWPLERPAQPDFVLILVAAHFPAALKEAEDFQEKCAEDYEAQGQLVLDQSKPREPKVQREAAVRTAEEEAYNKLRVHLVDELIKLNNRDQRFPWVR